MDTHEIFLRSRDGDSEAFRALVEHYQGYALRLAVRLLGSEDDAKDAVQDAFVRVWRHLPRFDPRARFTTWLYRIVTNLCYDRLKADRRRSRAVEAGSRESDPPAAGRAGQAPDRGLEAEEAAQRILMLSEGLPPAQRLVFVLRDLQDLSVKETAEVAGITEGAVKSNLYHARKALRGQLRRAGVGPGRYRAGEDA